MNNGNVNNNNKTNNNYVWPVRSGERYPLFSLERLYLAYEACRKRKRGTMNAIAFESRLFEELVSLRDELVSGKYQPSRSVCFVVQKPKMREIIAADFRDRVVHHLLVSELEKIFEPAFIHDSYACRVGKGTHAAVVRAQKFMYLCQRREKSPVYYCHIDIRNFFNSVNKNILCGLCAKKITDSEVLHLLHVLIYHNPTRQCVIKGKPPAQCLPAHKTLFYAPNNIGLPIGNLTSQFFANVYLNELDQYAKHELKCRYYIRYCDDMLVMSTSELYLALVREKIRAFCRDRLNLGLNPKSGDVKKVSSGMDFLGFIMRPRYRLVRRRSVHALYEKIENFLRGAASDYNGAKVLWYDHQAIDRIRSVIASYFGHFKWADTVRLKNTLFVKFPLLNEYISLNGEKLGLRVKPKRYSDSVYAQYHYYQAMFKDSVLFFKVGSFCEFYSKVQESAELLGLRIRKKGKMRFCGFPAGSWKKYAKLLFYQNIPIVFINETGIRKGRVIERLPIAKLYAA